MTTPELKACPFCGGDAEITQHAGYVNRKAYYVGCSDELCSIQPYSFGPLEQAIAAWNSRYRCTDRHECKKSGEIARQPAVKEETLSSTPQVAGQADCIPSAVEHPAKLPRELCVDISKLGLWYTDELFLSDSKPCEFDERQGNWIHFREVLE